LACFRGHRNVSFCCKNDIKKLTKQEVLLFFLMAGTLFVYPLHLLACRLILFARLSKVPVVYAADLRKLVIYLQIGESGFNLSLAQRRSMFGNSNID
jgi:hypothetical protein